MVVCTAISVIHNDGGLYNDGGGRYSTIATTYKQQWSQYTSTATLVQNDFGNPYVRNKSGLYKIMAAAVNLSNIQYMYYVLSIQFIQLILSTKRSVQLTQINVINRILSFYTLIYRELSQRTCCR